MRNFILAVIDFFHPPFKRFISLHNFRYFATGGSTMALGFLVYYLAYYNLFTTEDTFFLGIPLKRETAAYVIDVIVVIPVSFSLNKYVIFVDSEVKGITQFFRFLNLQWINIVTTLVLLKFFVEILHIYPTVSRFVITIGMALFSYLYQHYFTFSVKKLNKNKLK